MRSTIRTKFFLVLLVTLLSAGGANAAGIGNNIVVVLAGKGVADPSGNQFTRLGLDAPTNEMGELDVLCFDMDLVDAKTGNVIGSGSDCLSNIMMSPNGSTTLTATTFFHFPGGTLVSRGLVTVQPELDDSTKFTHITGAVPSPYVSNVLYGDGKFKNAVGSGSVRLSGAVDMSALTPAGGFIIDFDCVFIIDL